eukprot:1392446-Amorphochlora_amoeboformis.AAC.1
MKHGRYVWVHMYVEFGNLQTLVETVSSSWMGSTILLDYSNSSPRNAYGLLIGYVILLVVEVAAGKLGGSKLSKFIPFDSLPLWEQNNKFQNVGYFGPSILLHRRLIRMKKALMSSRLPKPADASVTATESKLPLSNPPSNQSIRPTHQLRSSPSAKENLSLPTLNFGIIRGSPILHLSSIQRSPQVSETASTRSFPRPETQAYNPTTCETKALHYADDHDQDRLLLEGFPIYGTELDEDESKLNETDVLAEGRLPRYIFVAGACLAVQYSLLPVANTLY